MNTLQTCWISLLLVLGIVIVGCEDDSAIASEDLVGRWEIIEAMRSGKVTTTMDQMFFDFTNDGALVTNMTGQEETYQYELVGNTIKQREGILEADYEVLHFSTDSLVLRSTIRQQLFQLTLQQSK